MKKLKRLSAVVLTTVIVLTTPITIINSSVVLASSQLQVIYTHDDYAEVEEENIIDESVLICVSIEEVSEPIIIVPEFTPIGEYLDIKRGYTSFDSDLQTYLWNRCKEYDVNYFVLMAQICEESGYDPQSTSEVRYNGYRDIGLVQINGLYLSAFQDELGYKFDPYNPYDAIDWLVHYHVSNRVYWQSIGIIDEYILNLCVTGSYNKGTRGMLNYISSYGYKYYYNSEIMQRSEQLSEIYQHTIQ